MVEEHLTTSKEISMIIEFLVSLITLSAALTLCSMTSGGFIFEVLEYPLIFGVPAILAIMIYLSGNGKSFLKIFAGTRKIKTADLTELKQMENAVSYAFKNLIYISLFFTLISGIYLYLNFFDTETLGPNLATVLCSIIYLCFFEMILLTLKGKIKNRMINIMAEEEPQKSADKVTAKKIILRIVKILVCILIIFILYAILINSETENNSQEEPLSFYYLRDLPGLIYTFVPTLILLAVSGNFINFFKAIKYSFKNERLTVTQKSVSVNAIETVRLIFLFEGIMCACCGCMGMLCNLEDAEVLGICFAISCVPFIYGLLMNIILLPVESKVSKQAD